MVRVERRVPHHRFEYRADVRHLYKLGLTRRLGVDLVSFPLDNSEYGDYLFAEIFMHELHFSMFKGKMEVTVQRDLKTQTFNAQPYAPERSPEGKYRFGLKLPRDVATEGEKVWVLMVDTEPGPELDMLPEQCVVPTKQGTQVIAYIEERRVMPLTVRVGRTIGGMVEVLEGLRTGDNVCLNPKEQGERLRRLRTDVEGRRR